MAVFRAIALIILFLVISGVRIPFNRANPRSKPILLIDASQSMRAHYTDHFFDNMPVFDHVRQFFSETLFVFDSLDRFGDYTDIIGALLASQEKNPSAILLISDGNHNTGKTMLSQLEDFPVPVYSFGTGTEETQDVRIIEIICPDYVHVGDSLNVTALVQSYGYDGGVATVEWKLGRHGAVLRQTFPLSSVRANNMISFPFTLDNTKDSLFTIRILPVPGESNTDNNSMSKLFIPLATKFSVFYYTDHLSFNTRFILEALAQDARLDITSIVRSGPGKYVDPTSGNIQHIPVPESINVLILDNAQCNTFPWNNISQYVQQGMGMLCLGTIQQQTKSWQDMLPIAVSDKTMYGNFNLEIKDTFSHLVEEKTYPPFSQMQRILSVKEDAVTIATVQSTPVIAYRRHGNGTVFQINSGDIGAWSFVQKGLQEKDMLPLLLSDIIRFVAPEGQNKRLVLASPHRTFAQGEAISLTLKSYDVDLRPSGGGDFILDFKERSIPFFEIAKGMYKTSIIADQAGTFDLIAKGTLQNEVLSSNTVTITVEKSSLERITELNSELLQAIAEKTGGYYFPIDSLKTFILPEQPKEVHTTYLDLNNPFTYVLILVLLASDWIIRRRKGMI